jgi:hypothetical protein
MLVRTKFLVGALLVSMTAVSACVEATSFEPMRLQSNVAPNTVQYDKSMGEDASSYFAQYSECLGDAFVNISKQRMARDELPSLQAKIYEDECTREERNLYQAIYSASKTFDPNGPEEFAHATALKGVNHAKKVTFDSLWEGFQPQQ